MLIISQPYSDNDFAVVPLPERTMTEIGSDVQFRKRVNTSRGTVSCDVEVNAYRQNCSKKRQGTTTSELLETFCTLLLSFFWMFQGNSFQYRLWEQL